MTDSEIFLNHLNDNYETLKAKYRNFCREKNYEWDEDVFSDTIIKCHEAISKKGSLMDNSPQGIENYFFKSFKINLQRESQYSRNANRDFNLSTDEVNALYETYYNDSNDSPMVKVRNDLYVDFATLYIMQKVEEHFDDEHFYLFKLKTLCNLTYRQLAQKTMRKSVRQKFLTVKNWVRENVTKEEIQKAFHLMYRELL